MSKLSRRGALAGACIIPSLATVTGAQANSQIAVALLGTGNRGRFVGKIFADDARVRISAMCDIDPGQIDRAKTGIPAAATARVFRDAGEMFAAGGFDAVLIATPVYLHPEHFELAARAGKHIYCEKPAGASVAGVKRLLRAAQAMSKSQVVFFGFQQRLSPEYLAAESIIRQGKLGELLLMRSEWIVGGVRFGQPLPSKEQMDRMWYPWRAKSGDFIVEQDCHGVDVLNWFARAHPLAALAGGNKGRRPFGDNLDHVNVTYYYPNNLLGYLHATQLAQAGRIVREQFFGTLGNIETQRRFYEVEYTGQKPQRFESRREITIDAVEIFLSHIAQGKQKNMAFDACDSTLTSLLGRLAVDRKREVTWEELLASEA